MSNSSLSPSTPSSSERLSPASAMKSGRRQGAFYPNTISKSPKPFSRSAAKRESVMALGSIEHLQYYFTKTGVSARQNPLKPTSNGVPALGPGVLRSTSPIPEDDSEIVLPPTPLFPQAPRIISEPHIRTLETDPDHLKPSVIDDLEAVERVWHFQTGSSSNEPPLNTTEPVDVLNVLKITTRAIRAVRNYVVSLRDELDFITSHVPTSEYRPSTFKPPTPKPRKVSLPDINDPLARVRRAALDALTALRHMEEQARVPLSDDVYDIQSDSGSASTRSHTPGGTERVSSPFSLEDDDESTASFSFSVIKVPNRKESVLVWSDDEEIYSKEEEKKDRWEERLVLAGGWLYKQDMTWEDFMQERAAISQYLDGIDEILFAGTPQQQPYERGWKKARKEIEVKRAKEVKNRRQSGEGRTFSPSPNPSRRVVSAGAVESFANLSLSEEPEEMLDSVIEEDEEEDQEGVPDEDLPDWAKRDKFADDPIARLLSLLVSLLPASLLHLLPPLHETNRESLLDSLSSGQALCITYNIGVRRSKKAWGYINNAAVHDMAALEAEAKNDANADSERKRVGWTFRRTDNLRLWMAALKLRYSIPLGPVLTPNTSRSSSPAPSGKPSQNAVDFLIFDPQLVSKRQPGWEDMLEKAIMKWMWCVVAEKRGTKI